MKKVVLFKSESEEYQNAFRESNFETIFVEPLQFVDINKEDLARKLLKKEYDGIIFTSPRAIEAAARCWDPTKYVLWNTKRIYTVGEASSHKITSCLGLEAMGSSSGNAENLAKIILNENPQSSKFLFPCGNLRSETLPAMLSSKGIIVDPVTVYETKENENLNFDLMNLNDSVHEPCCMVFFSPSGCEYIYRQLQTFSNRLSELPRFAIGNSTALKIETLGLEIAGVAAKPQAGSLVETVQNYFISLQTCR